MPAAPTNASQVVSATDAQPPYDGVGLTLDAGNVAAFDSVNGTYTRSATALPLGRWTCVTWQIHLAMDATGSVRTFVDGTATAQAAVDAWVDEIAVGTTPITCTD